MERKVGRDILSMRDVPNQSLDEPSTPKAVALNDAGRGTMDGHLRVKVVVSYRRHGKL